MDTTMNFSFAGCGFLGIYHVGVSSCLKQHAPHLVKQCMFAGASAGAMVACCLICDCCLGDCTTFTLRLATKARSYSIGPLHPSFKITKILREALREVLPSNAHEIATGKLFISLTRVSDRKNVVVSEYNSKEELIQALLCSGHVPLYSGLVPPSYRGVRYVDGGLSDNIPAMNAETVSISPFAGESDICPSDGSLNPLHIYLANTSMQCTMGNLYRISRALFPPHPEILSDMCQQGFDDTLKYLQNNKLLSCVRHLCIRSVVTTVPAISDGDHPTLDGDEEVCENDCSECKTKMQVALIDTLPHAVGSALQEACDSVNKGVKAYIYRHRALRLMSFLATPWFLPVDIGYTFAVRFLQYLPYLPHDMQLMYQETADLLRYLVTNIHHQRRRYTARFSCQLAITEVNYGEIDHDIYPSSSDDHSLSAQVPPNIRNLNLKFAVNLDSDMSGSQHSIAENIHDHLEAFSLCCEEHQRRGSNSVSVCNQHHAKSRRSSSVENCSELYDTFEQCLHISNQMESIMAYHYRDENNTMRFEEIYAFADGEIDLPSMSSNLTRVSSRLSKSSGDINSEGFNRPPRSSSFGSPLDKSVVENRVRPTPHLESDLEEFVGQRSEIMIKEHKHKDDTS